MKINSPTAIEEYASLVFDCDGVILNSNKIKTRAFYNAALPYGEVAAQALVNYHVANGGISRYKKFELFLSQMIPVDAEGPTLDELLCVYAAEVRQGLLTCEVAEGLDELRAKTPNANWLIVSGGDQAELRDIFATRRLSGFFDGGIFGSPDTKDQILARELTCGSIKYPALFFGDSKYDLKAATAVGVDFIFISSWSEIEDPCRWIEENKIEYVESISKIY